MTQLLNRSQVLMAGMVAAGVPIEPVAQSEWVDVPPSMVRAGETFALRVKGESMIEDGILPGDLVVVRKQSTAHNGQWASNHQNLFQAGAVHRTSSRQCLDEAIAGGTHG